MYYYGDHCSGQHRTETHTKFLSDYMKGRCIARENQAYVVVNIEMNRNEMTMGPGPCSGKAHILDQFANYQLLSNNSYSIVPVPLPTRSVAGLSPRRSEFDRRTIRVGSVVDKATGQASVQVLQFPWQYDASYSSTHSLTHSLSHMPHNLGK